MPSPAPSGRPAATIATFEPPRRRVPPLSKPAAARAAARAAAPHRTALPRRARAVRHRRHGDLRARRGRRLVGFTANSFNSVSLDPPLVVWSLARTRRHLAAFERADGYVINVLARRPGRPGATLLAAARRSLRRRRLPARTRRRPPHRRLRRVVRVPPPRAAARRRPRAVHRPRRRAARHAGAGLVFHHGRYGTDPPAGVTGEPGLRRAAPCAAGRAARPCGTRGPACRRRPAGRRRVVIASTSLVDDDSHISSAASASARETGRDLHRQARVARELERRVVGDPGQDQVVLRRRDDGAAGPRTARCDADASVR